jgi:hypothetical protein
MNTQYAKQAQQLEVKISEDKLIEVQLKGP